MTFDASLRAQRLENMVLPVTVHSYLSCFSTLAAKPENPSLDYMVRLTAVKLDSADEVKESSTK